VRAYTGDITDLLAHATGRGIALAGIDLPELRAWLGDLADHGLARASLARRAAVARVFFTWAHENGLVPANPALRLASPKVPRTLPTVLAAGDAARMLDSAARTAGRAPARVEWAAPGTTGMPGDAPRTLRAWAAGELLYGSGIRVGELEGADLADVDLDERTVRVRGKGDKERVVPFGIPAARSLQAWLAHGRPVLAGPASGPALLLGDHGQRWGARQIRLAIHRLALAAGVDDVGPHDLRHAAATHLVAGGSDLRSVQEILGHANLATTQRYTHVTADRLQAAFTQAFPRA
jgi:integrase/recombinase XerC